MRLIWNENPLNTVVELDEHDTEVLRLKITIDQMRWRLLGAHFHLLERRLDLDRARQECDSDYFYNEEGGLENSPLEQRVDMILEEYVKCLKLPHVGDCTCVACSCDKCHAEDLLGIHTTRGLGKHEASKIQSAFGEKYKPWKRTRNINEAIEYLENYDAAKTPPDWEGWEPHVDRWNTEAKNACKWLKKYRNERFSGLTPQ